MKPEKNSNAEKSGGWFTSIRNKILAVIGGVVVTVLSFIFAPIKEFILDLYPDKGTIGMDAPDELIVGQEFTIDPRVTPVGKLWHAVMRIKGSGNVTQPLHQSTFTIGMVPSEGPYSKLANAKPLVFKAGEEGTAHFECELLSGEKQISSHTTDIPIVRHREYAGDWQVQIGDTKGTMHLEETPDDDATVYGFYKLSTEIRGLISGKFDGAKLSGYLSIGDASSRLQILGDTHDAGGVVSVQGEATMYQAQGGGWQVMANQPRLNFQMMKVR
jgi:hypothetical protein